MCNPTPQDVLPLFPLFCMSIKHCVPVPLSADPHEPPPSLGYCHLSWEHHPPGISLEDLPYHQTCWYLKNPTPEGTEIIILEYLKFTFNIKPFQEK